MKTDRWIVDVGRKLKSGTMEEWHRINRIAGEASGVESESAGTGFGFRDQQFGFETRELAEQARERIRTAFGAWDDDEYLAVYGVDEEGYTIPVDDAE